MYHHLSPRLLPPTSKIAVPAGSKTKRMRHGSPRNCTRSSFMLVKAESSSVSTQGLPSCGPCCLIKFAWATDLVPQIVLQPGKPCGKIIIELYIPFPWELLFHTVNIFPEWNHVNQNDGGMNRRACPHPR